MLEHLEKFEGTRGTSYAAGLVALVAPTSLALFLFHQSLFLEIDIAKLLLLAGAVGGFCLFCGMIEANRTKPRQDDFLGALFVGAVFAGLAQFLGLALVCVLFRYFSASFGFKSWILLSTFFSVAMALPKSGQTPATTPPSPESGVG